MLQNPRKMHTYLVTTGEPKHRMAEGIGCNFLITNQGRVPALAEKKKWQQVMDALDDLQMGWMRVGIIPSVGRYNANPPWSNKTQQWDFSAESFGILKKVAVWARQRGVRLMFDPFGVPECFRKEGVPFAENPRLYAEKLILPLARYFEANKLDCFRYIGLFNENIWGPEKEGFAAVRKFYEMFKAVREVLDESGFPESKLGLVGPSALNLWEWPISDFMAAGVDPDPLWTAYDQHFYLFNFDWMHDNSPDFLSLTELTERYVRRFTDYAHKRGKPFFITEMGNFYCGRLFWGERDFDGPASHTSLMMDAELIVRSINEGADGFLRWAFAVEPTCDGRWSFLENHPDGMQRMPETYNLYRLLMRAVKPGATILEAQTDAAMGMFRNVFTAAVKNSDGSANLLLVNDFPGRCADVGLQLAAPFKGKRLYRTVWDETRKGAALPPVAISREGEGTTMLTPYSLTVLSTKELG